MKVNGRVIETNDGEVVVIPRPNSDIIFKMRPIDSYEGFLKVCPEPLPPRVKRPGDSESSPLSDDPGHVAALDTWNSRRFNWLIVQSLSATEGLEWDTVTDDPITWKNWSEDLKNSKFLQAEINIILEGVMVANALSTKRMDEARERFLASQRVVINL